MRNCLVLCALALIACGNPVHDTAQGRDKSADSASVAERGEAVKPPFAVRGEAEGLLLVWYDAEGVAHTAQKRTDIPETQREKVRVDSLDVAPDQRLDAAFVYVADLRVADESGSFPVRKFSREGFEATVIKQAPAQDNAPLAQANVIIYGADWCGACKSAAHYLEKKGVPFVEKNIEREPTAREEMLAKAQAQGVRTSGIPVIDVYGKILGGFNPMVMDEALARR
jgi:glutaredoxin